MKHWKPNIPNVGQNSTDQLSAADNTTLWKKMGPCTNINGTYFRSTRHSYKNAQRIYFRKNKKKRERLKANKTNLIQSLHLTSCWFMELTDSWFMRSHLWCASFWTVWFNIKSPTPEQSILQRNAYLFIQSLTHAYSSIYSPVDRTLLTQQIQIKHTL